MTLYFCDTFYVACVNDGYVDKLNLPCPGTRRTISLFNIECDIHVVASHIDLLDISLYIAW